MHTMPKDIYLLIWTKLEAVGPFSFGMNIWLNILFVELFDSISNASWSVRLNLPALFFWCVHAVLLYLKAESCDLTSVCVWLTLFYHDTHAHNQTKRNVVVQSCLCMRRCWCKNQFYMLSYTYTQAYCILYGFVSWLLVCTEPLFYDHQQPLSVFTFSIYF